ncbi:MAG: sulfite exporter TauE/SafE family protein, partial [Alphaproteobacteria bacterium]
MPAFPADPLFYLVGFTASFLMAFGKGAFGGGLAILGIPLLALVMDPIEAAIVTAVLVAAMDWVALGSFPKQSFSRP